MKGLGLGLGLGLNYSRLNPMLTENFYFTGVTDNDTNVSTLAGLLQKVRVRVRVRVSVSFNFSRGSIPLGGGAPLTAPNAVSLPLAGWHR